MVRKCIPTEECTICMTVPKPNEKIIQLECKHYFHKPCLKRWINTSIKDDYTFTCPTCRAISFCYPKKDILLFRNYILIICPPILL